MWEFYDFGYQGGGNEIQDWCDEEISDRARESFGALVKLNIKILNHMEWLGVDKHMQGALKGKGVWQWKIQGELAYRILGSFYGQKKAVFLIGYHHKEDVYTPPSALETAIDRKKLLDKGACKLYERQANQDS